MPDRRRIVRRTAAGSFVLVQDLYDDTSFFHLRDTFKVTAAPRQALLAKRQRRYGGALTIGETHDNGAIGFSSLVRGTSATDCLTKVEQLLSVLESPRPDLFFEWRPDGASNSTYYEIRGPATWQPDYSWAKLQGAGSIGVDVTIPVAPIAQLARVTQTITSIANMSLVQIPTAIGGTAPALVDVGIASGTVGKPIIQSMVIAWAPRAAAGPNGNAAPFGPRTGPDTAGTAGTWTFSTTNVTPDDFSDEIELDIWAKIFTPSGGNQRAVAQVTGASSSGGSAITSPRYTVEWGQLGTPLIDGGGYQLYRLGVIPVPVSPDTDPYWSLKITVPAGAKLSTVFINPARARASTVTGKPIADVRPFLIRQGSSPTTKTIRGQDLSGVVSVTGGEPLPDSGLGGSPIEMRPGLNDLMLLASNTVPNVADTALDLDYTMTAVLTITPRVWLAGS